MGTHLEVAVELTSGHAISWREFQTRYDALRSQSVSSIKFIHIQAYLVPILGCTRSCDGIIPKGSLYVQDRVYFRTSQRTDEEHILGMEGIEGCALLSISFEGTCTDPSDLYFLVRDKGTYWERVIKVKGYYMRFYDGKVAGLSCCPGVLQTVRLG